MDIDPKADRLVFFWSDRRNPHEVMPVFRPRCYSLNIYFFSFVVEGIQNIQQLIHKLENNITCIQRSLKTTCFCVLIVMHFMRLLSGRLCAIFGSDLIQVNAKYIERNNM
ncbi:unnamed protein product [Strongylus vulgaris]|uniref:Prolyl 4-hydroxylase alpha subunit Fe(2+) 2OG dioxygenase domain-containing protein n=1 Tax=Strongylus vulgaris TaxID=40348 RepID=A0A3P7KT73_STRVU|nr:unnamed protein product [Strongylus vulgaris]